MEDSLRWDPQIAACFVDWMVQIADNKDIELAQVFEKDTCFRRTLDVGKSWDSSTVDGAGGIAD